jgi:hypothetical protein
MVSELRFYQTVGSGQQRLLSVIQLSPEGVFVAGSQGPAAFLFQGNDLADPLEVRDIMKSAPLRFDGGYVRAEYLEYVDAGVKESDDAHWVTIDKSPVLIGGPGEGGGAAAPGGTYQVGITSARPWKSAPQVEREMADFKKLMEGTPVKNLSVDLGRGGWEGGSEPTFVTQYSGNGEALKALARFAKKHNQDAVLVQRYTTENDPQGQPQNRVSFNEPMNMKILKGIEAVLVQSGLGGWTWANLKTKPTLIATCVPEFGGEKSAHLKAFAAAMAALTETGIDFTEEGTWYVIPDAIGRDEYDAYLK